MVLINLLFNKIKIKKAALDAVKCPTQLVDLTELRQQLQIFLSLHRYNALIEKMRNKGGFVSLHVFVNGFFGNDRYDTVIKIVKTHLPKFVPEEFKPFRSSAHSCCIIA